MAPVCKDIALHYQAIQALRQEYEVTYEESRATRDISRVKALWATLEEKRSALAKTLLPYRWKRFDPRSMPKVERKEGYRETAKLEGHAGWVRALHVLPDESIVSGGDDGAIQIRKPDGKGGYGEPTILRGTRWHGTDHPSPPRWAHCVGG